MGLEAVLAKQSSRRQISHGISYVLLITGSILFLLPFIWMLSTSLKPLQDALVTPPKWIPQPFTWENYAVAWTQLPFNLFLRNSVLITVNNVAGTVVSSALAAFAFARLKCRWKNSIFILVLATMMIPNQVRLVPMYIIFNNLGWVDTFKPLMIPSWFGWPFFIFILRQFFMTIPLELDEAARLDGASSFMILTKVILPLSKPALATVAIFGFIANWNDFMNPLIYLNSRENYTMALGLQLFRGQYYTQINLLMAMAVAMLLPILVLFFSAQKVFVKGINLTGIKG